MTIITASSIQRITDPELKQWADSFIAELNEQITTRIDRLEKEVEDLKRELNAIRRL